MQHKPGFPAVLILIGLMLFQGVAPDLQAQGPPPPTPQQLDQLLAPIALYPDALLAQITTASTIRRRFWMSTTGWRRTTTSPNPS